MVNREQSVFTLALIPAFSPEEKENRSPVSWDVMGRRLADARRATARSLSLSRGFPELNFAR